MIFTLPHEGAVTVNAGRITYDFNGEDRELQEGLRR